MAEARLRRPSILVSYPGPDPSMLDIFVYLRPETNGVAVESTILKVVKEFKRESASLDLVYLANVPGDHIIRRRIVERHYSLRLFFAIHGGNAFSPDMKDQFSNYYGCAFEQARVIGAFDALRRFRWEPEDLFGLWVDENAVTRIAGQVIKRYQDYWIVNYDIPALLHKNSARTDIAVMTFRTAENYVHFFELAGRMKEALVDRGLLQRGMPIARAVHISRSPFEQLLDARDYLFSPDGEAAGVGASSFARYLLDHAVTEEEVQGFVDHPICRFDFGVDAPRDQNLLDLCEGFGYQDALHIIQRIQSQSILPRTTSGSMT
jgi:hypothetical protein